MSKWSLGKRETSHTFHSLITMVQLGENVISLLVHHYPSFRLSVSHPTTTTAAATEWNKRRTRWIDTEMGRAPRLASRVEFPRPRDKETEHNKLTMRTCLQRENIDQMNKLTSLVIDRKVRACVCALSWCNHLGRHHTSSKSNPSTIIDSRTNLTNWIHLFRHCIERTSFLGVMENEG